MADGINTKKPVIHTHEGTGLKFIRGAKQVLFETGVVIPRDEFDSLENGGLAERLEGLKQKPGSCNYDFIYGCSTGVLRHRKGTANIRPEVKPLPEPVEEPKDTEEIETVETAVPGFKLSSVFIVTVVMIVVGIGSAVMSAYHTSAFLIEGGKPVWTGMMTGIMFILFSGTAFTAARHFLREKGAQKIFGVLFVAAGFAVITYSVFSTLTVNYNQFKRVADKKTSVAVEDSETLAAHERLLAENGAVLNEISASIARMEAEADYWRTMSWKRYDEFQTRLTQLHEERSALRQRRIELESAKPELIAQAENSQETVYALLSRLLKIPEDAARFFVYVAPACLYDVLAPFALSIVLLLTDGRNKKEDK